MLERKEGLQEKSIQIPGSIEAAVTSRIDSLTKEATYLLKIASIIGRTFPQTLLETVVKEKDIATSYPRLMGLAKRDFSLQRVPQVNLKDQEKYLVLKSEF